MATIIGSDVGEYLPGENTDDTIIALAGDDTLEGGAGNDTLLGDSGNDSYVFRSGFGHDEILDSRGSEKLLFKDATGLEDFSILLDDGDVVITIAGGSVNIAGARYEDGRYSIHFGESDELLGKLTIGDSDNLSGDAGKDWLVGLDGDNVLEGGGGDDILAGGAGADTLEGGGGDDILVGGAGADTLEGGAGNDILRGGSGADTLDGGDGTDVASYGRSSQGSRVDLSRIGAQIDFDGTHGFTANNNEAVGDILSNVENLIGSNYADWLTGDGGDNVIQGGSGNDRLEGGAGADTYVFEAGDDMDTVVDDGGRIVFAQGTDNDYAGATYTFIRADTGSSATVTLAVRDSDGNTLNAIEFTTYPSSGYIFYTRDSNGIDSEIDASLLVVPPRVGSEENPFLATRAADTFVGDDGEEGWDWVSYAGSVSAKASWEGVDVDLRTTPANVSNAWAIGDRLTGINNLIGSNASDRLRGNSGDNILRGGGGGDRLYGGEGADTLYGGAGGDELYGGAGADILDGGDGHNDYARYTSSSQGVRVDLSNIGAQQDFDGTHGFVANNNEAVGDILTSIEYITGSNHDDWLIGDGGNNHLQAGDGDDRIEGGAGSDSLHGGSGDDHLYGGDGDDHLYGGYGEDQLYGGDGDDHLYGGYGEDQLYGGAGDDRLIGDDGEDQLYGGAGNDDLEGGLGADTLIGGTGDDAAIYEDAGEGVRVDLSLTGVQQDFAANSFGFTANNNEAVGDILSDIEAVEGSAHADWLTGDDGVNSLLGGAGDDWLDGDGGDDRLEGGLGADTLIGGAGDDIFNGGHDDDVLYGGAGADTYAFYVSEGTDTIYDEAGDTLTLRFNDHYTDTYTATDFVEASNNFNRVGNNLEITIDKVSDDDITDKITIFNAYDTDISTGTGAAAFTISIEYGRIEGDTLTEVTNDFWHNFYAKGSEENPFLATEAADTFAGTDGEDWGWVSYAGSTSGVDVDLRADLATVSGGWATGDRLTGINNLIGSDADDTLEGNSDDNTLRGGDGDDQLVGGDGDDRLEGGAGDDSLWGGKNWGGSGDDHLYGGAGDDTLRGGPGADILDGGDGTDFAQYYYTSLGGVRVDLSRVGAQINFDGTRGFTANDNDAVGDILSNVENIGGTYRDDWLTGDDGDNFLHGSKGNDLLEGGAGDDILAGSLGDDHLEGGAGADTYWFSSAYMDYYDDGTDTIHDEAGDTMTLRFSGFASNPYTASDFVEASNNFKRVGNNLEINIGTNEITILNAYDTDTTTGIGKAAFTIIIEYGGRNYDTLTEVANDFWHNFFAQGSEENPFLATEAADTFAGSDGTDWVSYAGSVSARASWEGVDVDLRTTLANVDDAWAIGDTLTGINNLIGSDAEDALVGNSGDNILRGGAGDDWLFGHEGMDTLEGGAGDDRLEGGAGVDTLEGGADNDYLFGNEGADTLDGGAGNDYLFGHEGTDTLEGGAGDDRLNGGDGDDRLEGGLGADTYTFDTSDGTDTIADEAGDTLTLRFEDYSYTASDFVEGSNNFNRVGDDLEISVGGNEITILNAYDSDSGTGTGNAAFTISVEYGFGNAYTEVTDAFWHTLSI